MPAFLDHFRHAAGATGRMSFAAFMRLALYDPEAGYYAAARTRVGRNAEADFFTASNSEVFGELVAASCAAILGASAADHAFVEIGAEPGGGVLTRVAHPFREIVTLRLGDALRLPSRAVVFSNELFDAQPFHRLMFRDGAWREQGVELTTAGTLRECELPGLSPELAAVGSRLPAAAREGYRLDVPLAAMELCRTLAAPSWTGVFVAFDYGKSWSELAGACPDGTARAYHRHTPSNDLLARPGEQDLTCHICWDWLSEVLAANGFSAPTLESQEGFFVHHAASVLSAITSREAAGFSARKQSLLQLLHPANMGRKFQVLWARRPAAGSEQ